MERDAVDRIQEQWRATRPDLDPAPMGVIGRISRLAQHLDRELLRAFSAHGLTGADFDVLATLRRSGEPFRLSPARLCDSTMVTSGGMTKRLDRLEAAGLVGRERDPDDRRGRLVVLTDEGRALVDAAVEDHLRNEQRLLAPLSEAQRRELAGLLRALLLHLEPEPGYAGQSRSSRSSSSAG